LAQDFLGDELANPILDDLAGMLLEQAESAELIVAALADGVGGPAVENLRDVVDSEPFLNAGHARKNLLGDHQGVGYRLGVA
jgi:hypothetical protein